MDRAAAATGTGPPFPRNVLHADLLAWIAGEQMFSAYYERVRAPGGKAAIALGVSFAKDVTADTGGGADVREVESDLFGIGAQWRHYSAGAPRGLFVPMSLSLVGGEGTGRDSANRRRGYRFAGYDVGLLGIGYQQRVLDRFTVEAMAALHTALGWLWEKEGGDHGTTGGFGIGVSGGLGFAF